MSLAERCTAGPIKGVSRNPPQDSPCALVEVFALRVVGLLCTPGRGAVLACAPYIDTPEIAENFLKIFCGVLGCGVLGCREVSERGGWTFGALVKGYPRIFGLSLNPLWTLFGAKFWKILKKICRSQSRK